MPTTLEVLEKAVPPIHNERIDSGLHHALALIEVQDMPGAIWIDLEDVLSEEWEIGGPAMTARDATGPGCR